MPEGSGAIRSAHRVVRRFFGSAEAPAHHPCESPPTLFVVETQYTPKRSDADHSPIRGRTIHRLKITGSAPKPASSRGSRVRKLKNEILCRIGARARHIRFFENRYTLKTHRWATKVFCTLQKKKPPPLYDTAKTYRSGELKTAAYAIQPTEDQSMVLNRNAP